MTTYEFPDTETEEQRHQRQLYARALRYRFIQAQRQDPNSTFNRILKAAEAKDQA